MPITRKRSFTIEVLEDKGYEAAENDYPNFKTKREVSKDHGPAWVRGYMNAVAHKESEWDEESRWEYDLEKAAERYYEEGPHGNMYDDPRGE